jgi:Zn-dependent protease with chaperone function
MFALRGIAVSLAIAVIVYVCVAILISVGWRLVWSVACHYAAESVANLLFILRLAPLVVAVIATLVFAVPSFLLLEPRTVSEPIGAAPLAISSCGLIGILWGISKAGSGLLRASRAVARWSSGAAEIELRDAGSNSVSILRSSSAPAPLTAAGILKSTIWISHGVESLLSEQELKMGLQHELVHVRRKDNLRKLMFRLIAFPGMTDLEYAWGEATEMAADDGAVSSAAEALDLAGAVIKLSRFAPLEPPGELTTALVHSPWESVNARVKRLLAWNNLQSTQPTGHAFRYAVCVAGALAITFVTTYTHLLVLIHSATELLVR